MKRYLWLFLLSMCLFVSSAHATLIKNGSVITDTDAGLEWLELSVSTGFTYNQMLDNFQDESSLFYGYEYASRSLVENLFNNLGYSGDFYDPVTDLASKDAITDIYDLFGQTGDNCCERGDGMFLNEGGDNVDWLFYIPDTSIGNESVVRLFTDSFDPDDLFWGEGSSNEMGSWVVKSTVQVPEPASFAILGIGLIGLGLARKRV